MLPRACSSGKVIPDARRYPRKMPDNTTLIPGRTISPYGLEPAPKSLITPILVNFAYAARARRRSTPSNCRGR